MLTARAEWASEPRRWAESTLMSNHMILVRAAVRWYGAERGNVRSYRPWRRGNGAMRSSARIEWIDVTIYRLFRRLISG